MADESATDGTADKTTEKAPAKKARSTTGKTAKTAKTAKVAAKRPAKKTAAATTEARRRPTAGAIARQAAAQLQDLTGQEVEGVTGVRRDDDGWIVEVDVLELRRIPATTDVLATYEVEVDESGDLVGYRRGHRFVRGNVGD